MNYSIVSSARCDKDIKRLSKKYHSFKQDLQAFQTELLANPLMGVDMGGNMRKVRMSISSKSRGKSGGARVITYHLIVDAANAKIYLLTIYDKSEQANISSREIANLKRICGLL